MNSVDKNAVGWVYRKEHETGEQRGEGEENVCIAPSEHMRPQPPRGADSKNRCGRAPR